MIKKDVEGKGDAIEAEAEDDEAANDGDIDAVDDGDGEKDQETEAHVDGREAEQKQDTNEAEKTNDATAIEADDDWNVVGKRDRRHLRRAERVVYPTIDQKARDALLEQESY